MKKSFTLQGKVAIVTGGNGGIGKGIAPASIWAEGSRARDFELSRGVTS